jgi:hypothetical protein
MVIMKLRNHIKDTIYATRSIYSIFDHIIQLLIYYIYMAFSEMSIYIYIHVRHNNKFAYATIRSLASVDIICINNQFSVLS